MPKFTVHDVEHGQLISLSHQGQLWLWDCGATMGHAPTKVAQAEGRGVVDLLFVTHYDEDHLTGLPELRARCRISRILRNKSITGAQLAALKTESGYPLTAAMKSAIDMFETYTGTPAPGEYPNIPGVSYTVFHNSYPTDAFDTNNISSVTVLKVGQTKIVISSDVEASGWQTLLDKHSIADSLRGTDVFIASHHGRENGYHDDVMRIAAPQCVIMSDYEVRHSTQENMVARYSKHTSGIQYKGESRWVLTTRKDGHISWDL